MPGISVAQSGAGGGQVEHVDHLGAEHTGELRVATDGVLSGDAALLVRGGTKRQVGDAQRSVVGHDTVSSRPHMRDPGAHPTVDP